ncbi:uncharacterized protein LOC143904452 [Temnothorax americanus]|uniref:uncharacterized protein LOC143904452 n=1 Tax=Temnothorax americanus TaxID=1964332 RepID=UPI004067F633
MADEIRALIQRRATIKAHLTRFNSYLEKWSECPDKQQLIERLEKFKNTWDSFDEVQTNIDLVNATATGAQSDDNERAIFEESYFQLAARAQRRLASVRPPTADDDVATVQNQPVQNVSANIKLPTINLPTFSGNYEAWLGFYDNFKSIVHDNANLTPVQKLQYLRSSLSDEAAQVIQSLETSSQNYEVAWALIVERYDNRRIIIQSHIRALFDLPVISKESSTQLRSLVDAALRHTRALHALGQPTKSWDALLFHLLTSKLDRSTHKEWERSLDGTDMPSIDDFWKFLKNRCHVLESVSQEVSVYSNQLAKNQARSNNMRGNQKTRQALVTVHTKLECAICKQNHNTFQCEQFLKMNRDARFARVKSMGLCYNCLRPNHLVDECKSGTCRKCKRKHHTLLHSEGESFDRGSGSSNAANANPIASLQAVVASQVLLATASVRMLNNRGEPIKCRVLLDNGSQSNFVTEKLCNILNLAKREVSIPVSGFNQSLTHIKHSVTTTLQSRDGRFAAELSFLVVPRITETLPAQTINRYVLNLPRNVTLADPEFCTPSEVDALIGAELFYQLLCVGQIKLSNSALILQKTRLGWIISGAIHSRESASNRIACNLVVDSLDAQVSKFWELEEVSSVKHLSKDEEACEKHFSQTYSRDESGRYTVRLPFNHRKRELGDSYQIAKKRLYSLERRLAQDPQLREEYTDFLDEYERLGHMIEISASDVTKDGYFIPHHPVFKRDSHTTKLRVVFNASSKSSSGVSLNDVLLAGPTLQEDLFSIVTRFRTHRYVLTADIEKMYRQVRVHPEDVKYQMILWRKGPNDPIRILVLTTATYGTIPASFLVVRSLQQLSKDERRRFPLACRVLLEDFYMDDALTGTSNLEEAQRLRDELIELLACGGFHLRKWCSNEPSLLEPLLDKSMDPHICLSESETQKTLGIHWHPRDDQLIHVVKPFTEYQRTTKRTMLSQIASLFDPLGLVGPVIVKAKILLQQLWQNKLDWDESVPVDIATSWNQYKEQIEILNNFVIPRQITAENVINIQLHGFCDASEKAYGAVLYLRSTTSSGIHIVRLVCSKTRVAPIKRLTLPRLELSAAALLGKLYKSTIKSIRINLDEEFFWSDSTITLHWIQTSPHKLKTFVANRVSRIQESTKHGKWRHVPSQDNPADALSRGQFPCEFVNNPIWKNGPFWLSKDEAAWPSNLIPSIEIPEQRSIVVLSNVHVVDTDLLSRFSSFARMKRIIAYCIRFASRCRSLRNDSEDLSTEDLKKAEMRIVKLVQITAFESELRSLSQKRPLDKKSNILSLSPFLDDDGVLRVGGRLRHADLKFSQRHPILLPSNNHITELIIRETHVRLCHAGSQATLYAIREKYWLLNGRNRVKGVIRKCVMCSRWRPSTPQYEMGNLPKIRLVSSRPFENVGIDFCGPFLIKEKKYRNRNKIKIYVAVFVCLVTKAIHLEIVSDLTTEAFVACLKRLFARRGRARVIWSDNGTNFLGASNHLKEIFEFFQERENEQKINRYLVNEGIQWSFIPPRSPHFGGIWEASVRGFKHHMRRMVGDALFTFEEFNTFVIEVEAILNSRPLTPMSSDPNDPLALTPAHFLINASLQSIPEYDLTNENSNRLSSWQHIQRVKQHFWKRWNKEYLNELQQRTKWVSNKAHNINIGDLVILKEENTPPLRWITGRVIATHPGDDGIVRVVTVKTAHGVYKRCVKKISPLPIIA